MPTSSATAQNLTPAETRLFKADPGAWEFFSELAPSYRHKVLYWITSSRKPETREIAADPGHRRLGS